MSDAEQRGDTGGTDGSRDSILAIAGRMGPAAYLAVAWALVPAVLGITLLANMGGISNWLADQGLLAMPRIRPVWGSIEGLAGLEKRGFVFP